MDLGLHTTLVDANSKADPEVIAISARITPLQAKEFGKVWDLFTTRATPFSTDQFDVLSRNYTTPAVTLGTASAGDWGGTSATTALPINSGTIDRITVGDIILVDAEVVVVKAINRTTNVIEVYERGAGGTTAATHTTATVAKIIGNANIEGTVVGEARAEGTTKVSNYCQIIQEVVDLSKEDSDEARKTGMTADTLKSEALERVMRDLARSAIYGVPRVGTATIPAMTRGLISYLRDVSGAIKTAVGGAFTETALKNILDDVRNAGGTVNGIVMSVKNKRTFNGFTGASASQFPAGQGQTQVGGIVLDGYLADGFGVIPAIVDIDMPDDMVAVVNTRFLTKGWKVNDELRFVPETNTSSREKKETLQGKFGLSVEGVGRTHGLLTSLS
jgi:hypothetical protein